MFSQWHAKKKNDEFAFSVDIQINKRSLYCSYCWPKHDTKKKKKKGKERKKTRLT